jgi:hypothetical protein
VADIDVLYAGAVGLVETTYRIASGLFQAFGAPEATLLTSNGGMRLQYWHRSAQDQITRWAEAVGVVLSHEVLT